MIINFLSLPWTTTVTRCTVCSFRRKTGPSSDSMHKNLTDLNMGLTWWYTVLSDGMWLLIEHKGMPSGKFISSCCLFISEKSYTIFIIEVVFMRQDFERALWMQADASGHAVSGVGLRPLACWDGGFESRRPNGCLSLVTVVYDKAEVSSSGWSLVQRSPTECGVCTWVSCEASIMSKTLTQ